jgi:hypothetical protein
MTMPDENTTETELDVLLRTMLAERRAREFQKKKTIETLFAALCTGAIDKGWYRAAHCCSRR